MRPQDPTYVGQGSPTEILWEVFNGTDKRVSISVSNKQAKLHNIMVHLLESDPKIANAYLKALHQDSLENGSYESDVHEDINLEAIKRVADTDNDGYY